MSQQAEPEVSVIRRALLSDCNTFIYTHLPTYLLDVACIRLSDFPADRHVHQFGDIKLVPRDQISKHILMQVEVDLQGIPEHDRESWRQSCMQRYKSQHRYAILSHRWGIDEPTFRQMLKNEAQPAEGPSAGVTKLLEFCRVAATDYKCSYAWSDTCCIDKQSSAELEEAIRSMYRWYKDSEICIVHLGSSFFLDDLEDDPWFKRGWTLQELLAPTKIKFYRKDWTPMNAARALLLNDKEDTTMTRLIEEITGIPQGNICNFRPSCNRVSEKMRWMALRQTTRPEDVAYCLIGIFDVTMSISYGEGPWAFHRLMETIARRCFDPGFFAWCGDPSPYSLLLPSSPSCYQLDRVRADLLQLGGFSVSTAVGYGDPSWEITKTGLEINVLPIAVDESPFTPIEIYALPKKLRIAIPLDTPTMDITARLRSAKPSQRHALGVINYHRISAHHGSVSAKANYYCLLLTKEGADSWRKERTEHVVVLKCQGALRGKVVTISLAHSGLLSSYYAL